MTLTSPAPPCHVPRATPTALLRLSASPLYTSLRELQEFFAEKGFGTNQQNAGDVVGVVIGSETTTVYEPLCYAVYPVARHDIHVDAASAAAMRDDVLEWLEWVSMMLVLLLVLLLMLLLVLALLLLLLLVLLLALLRLLVLTSLLGVRHGNAQLL